ncbi:uncharacterized protein BO88DRAFT_417991 [Aspergillus vadensis CBS 113365]|uniref:Uncharacterized protein n=1 Tax=Aspergillus vadensis (strain CBS 113365 / IMI 142717 / IBT 24658) TaxID=1448311 RepID=A0A319B1V3_ASPVC|nr:hypothetical protein BO88DRAFT_417991 [Aspergillus vadensis CBS 113365]PYH65824.1 hypothetical protein BO88DRAFT_417991 [Aspergillus vadensis CBS 113365]
MKLIPIFTTLAFAGATSAATCAPGLNYCADTLTRLGNIPFHKPSLVVKNTHSRYFVDRNNDDAMRQALIAYWNSWSANYSCTWDNFVFHCDSDHSITVAKRCAYY